MKDDRDVLIQKMMDSDGVVFASRITPFGIRFHENFLDRLGFMFHRPRFFGKTFTGIVAQGIYGAEDIVKYLDFVGGGLGFNVVKGFFITTLEPVTEKQQKENDALIERQSRKFHAQLMKKEFPVPSLFKLMIFRMSRSSMKAMLDDSFRDYTYYRDRGWFESDYYYAVKMNPLKKMIGRLFDFIATRTAKGGDSWQRIIAWRSYYEDNRSDEHNGPRIFVSEDWSDEMMNQAP